MLLAAIGCKLTNATAIASSTQNKAVCRKLQQLWIGDPFRKGVRHGGLLGPLADAAELLALTVAVTSSIQEVNSTLCNRTCTVAASIASSPFPHGVLLGLLLAAALDLLAWTAAMTSSIQDLNRAFCIRTFTVAASVASSPFPHGVLLGLLLAYVFDLLACTAAASSGIQDLNRAF